MFTHTQNCLCDLYDVVTAQKYLLTNLYGPVVTGLYKGCTWLYYRGRLWCFSAILVLFGAREAGCFREVAALRSVRYAYRQDPLYYTCLDACMTT